MQIIQTIDDMRNQIKTWKKEGLSIGFVPTMGFLHEGHKSMISRAASENDKVVVSIFVNPAQFAAGEDLETYPRDLEHDANLCEEAGADIIFHPTNEIMYEKNALTQIMIPQLSKELCGKTRPTHFSGVCLVVSKLFNIVTPDRAYFGQKDAQQLAIISRMVKDLNFDVEIVPCPIVREEDGLAKSSRNIYLLPDERKAAVILNQTLANAKTSILLGERNAHTIRQTIIERIKKERLATIDYVEVVDYETLKKEDELSGIILVAVAVYFGKARLIDNVIIDLK